MDLNRSSWLLILLLAFFNQVNSKDLIDYVNPQNIIQNLREFTEEPHVAGTVANKRVADKILAKWKEYGLEDVRFDSYKVLLSYPNYTNPNHIRILDKNDKLIFESSGISPAIFPKEQGDPHAGVQWLAYSANGTFKGQPIYCNYGTAEDFEKLSQLGVSVKGKIALIRYGLIFRGDKIRLAQEHGASAAILFSDPQDCAPDGTDDEHVYPQTDYMPKHGVQRGSLKEMDGDPLTPFYPAKKDLYSPVTIQEIRKLGKIPSIPVLPLSYGDIYHVLNRMKGKSAPKEWQGGLDLNYKIGDGGFDGILEVEVHSSLEKRTIQNVIGYIKGEIEPDRYVILGNHFDAWVYGSIDPNSGSAILSETVRAMVEARKDGVWKPRRSVLFCNWDGEEHGLIGSAEFVENYQLQLTHRAVTYLNVDLIYGNGSFSANTVPTMYDVVVETAKKIPNPLKSETAKGRKTVYDTWIHNIPGKIEDRPDFPELSAPGGGSDHERFMSYLGVPVIDFRFVRNDRNPKTNTTYPLYHSLYETPFVNEHIFDHDGFAIHKATAQYWAKLAQTFSSEPILPLNVSMLAHRFLDGYVKDLKADIDELSKTIPNMERTHQQVSLMIRNVQEFVRRASTFSAIQNELRIVGDNRIRRDDDNNLWIQIAEDEDGGYEVFWMQIEETSHWVKIDDPKLRTINDKLMSVDRCFVSPTAIPNSPLKRNILFSTSELNNYASKVMPAIYDQINYLKSAKSESEQEEIIGKLTEQISVVQFSIQCATNTLSDLL